jgi:hypothetical protein
MMSCSEAQKIFGINPTTGFKNKSTDKDNGNKRYYTFDPDYAYSKISFSNRKDSKYQLIYLSVIVD